MLNRKSNDVNEPYHNGLTALLMELEIHGSFYTDCFPRTMVAVFTHNTGKRLSCHKEGNGYRIMRLDDTEDDEITLAPVLLVKEVLTAVITKEQDA